MRALTEVEPHCRDIGLRDVLERAYHRVVTCASISFATGRAWLQNPDYRAAARSLGAGPLGAAPSQPSDDFRDVLEIRVDGVNVTADVLDGSLPRTVTGLARAADSLARGSARAGFSFGGDPAELIFAREGDVVLLTLLLPGNPPRTRIGDLSLEAETFFRAVASCLNDFLDALAVAVPRLSESALARALTATAHRLEAAAVERNRPTPPLSGVPTWQGAPSRASTRAGAVQCDVVLEDTSGVAAHVFGDEGDIYSLLSKGRLELATAGGRRIASWRGAPFLALRAAVREIRDVLSAWEADEPSATLFIGDDALALDLASRALVEPRVGERLHCGDIIGAILRGALELHRLVVSAAPAQRSNSYLEELESDAFELLDLCALLSKGDVEGDVPSPSTTARGAPPPTVSRRPLGEHGLRRVLLASRWRFDAGPLLGPGVGWFGRRVLVHGEDGAFALDPDSGELEWQRERVDAVWFGPHRSAPVVMAGAMGLDLVTPAGATAWTAEPPAVIKQADTAYLVGGESLILCADGRTVTAFRRADGRVCWEFTAPGSSRAFLTGSAGGCLLATDNGFIHALDAATGRPRWRARTLLAPSAAPVCVDGVIYLVGRAKHGPALFTACLATGREPQLRSLRFDEMGGLAHTGGRIVIAGTVAGEAAVHLVASRGLDRLVILDGLREIPSLLPVRSKVFACDRQGALIAIGARGKALWRCRLSSADEHGRPPPLLAASRNMLLVVHEKLHAVDTRDGRLLGSVNPRELFSPHTILADDGPRILVSDAEGTVEAFAPRTHLSVVE